MGAAAAHRRGRFRTKAATRSAPPTWPEVMQGDHLGAELRDSLTPVARLSEGIDHRTLRTSDQGAGADGVSLPKDLRHFAGSGSVRCLERTRTLCARGRREPARAWPAGALTRGAGHVYPPTLQEIGSDWRFSVRRPVSAQRQQRAERYRHCSRTGRPNRRSRPGDGIATVADRNPCGCWSGQPETACGHASEARAVPPGTCA